MKKNNKVWIKKRHFVIQKIAKFFLKPIIKLKYGCTIEKCNDTRQQLIIGNHQTAFDQFFVGYAFKMPIYYVASEDIFSNGLVSKLLKFAVNPIPIKKQTHDIRAVMNCMRVAKEGGSIGIFPEGNRTFSGATEDISIAIVKLVKALKIPLTFFRIEGGYGVQPRWSDCVRKGKMRSYVSKTIEPEEYLAMNDQELYSVIKKELFVDERQIVDTYKSKKLAECLERVVYVCPECGLTKFESNNDKIRCLTCNKEIQYLDNKKLKGINFQFPFEYVKEWYDFQNEYVNNLKIEDYFDKSLFVDNVNIFDVELYKKKRLKEKNIELALYGNKLKCKDSELLFDDISSITVLGRNKLNIYYADKVYQIKGDKRFNAVKYVNIFYRYKNYKNGDCNGKFLGL